MDRQQAQEKLQAIGWLVEELRQGEIIAECEADEAARMLSRWCNRLKFLQDEAAADQVAACPQS